MRVKRHIIRATVAVFVATALGLGTPGTASAGGIDPTRWCVQDAASDFLYYPYSIKQATRLVIRSRACAVSFAGHMVDAEQRAAWIDCLEYGLARSVPPLMWDPFIAALYDCTSRWLEFEIQIDPNP